MGAWGDTNGQEGAERSLGKAADPKIGVKTLGDRFWELRQKISSSFALQRKLPGTTHPWLGDVHSSSRSFWEGDKASQHFFLLPCGDRAPSQCWTKAGEPPGERGAGVLRACGAHHPRD